MQPRPPPPFLSPCQLEEGAPAWETKSAHQQLPDGQRRPGWAGIPSSSSAPPHARSCPDPSVRGSRGHPLVAQTVALPVSRDRGRGEAAGHRGVRTGGPPAEPCGTGAAGRTCEQSTESEARGWRGSGEVGWVWGETPGSADRRGQGSPSPVAVWSRDPDPSPPAARHVVIYVVSLTTGHQVARQPRCSRRGERHGWTRGGGGHLQPGLFPLGWYFSTATPLGDRVEP